MRFLTFNIRLGIESSLERVAEVIVQSAADVVALQEVGRHWVMGPRGDTLAALSDITGLRWRAYHPALRLHPLVRPWTCESSGLGPRALDALTRVSRRVRPPGPHVARYGVGLLSRWALSAPVTVPLWRGVDEQRVMGMATVQSPSGPVPVLVTHLAVHHHERVLQAHQVAALAKAAMPGGVVMGDLNDVPWSDTLAVFASAGLEGPTQSLMGPTYPAASPMTRLDYVLAGGRLEVVSDEVLPVPGVSDHLPVLAEVELRG